MSLIALSLASCLLTGGLANNDWKANLDSKFEFGFKYQLLAQQYGSNDPHGEDPHGVDPHDEYHDETLPANDKQDKYKATDNVYGKDVVNTQMPYSY